MPIEKVYLSSTFKDLEHHRSAVARALGRLNVLVVGMEGYVAADERPLDKCLKDVKDCDLYVGLFAHRYGFVPKDGNPTSASITELEYRHARAHNIDCLVFVLEGDEPWPPPFMDDYTKEGEGGTRISKLRSELIDRHVASLFRTKEELAALVTASVALEQRKDVEPHVSAETNRIGQERRQILSDLLIAYAPTDDAAVDHLAKELLPDPLGLSSRLAPRALLARTPNELLQLEMEVQSCDVATVFLSGAALTILNQDRRASTRVLSMLRDRTGTLIGLCAAADVLEQARVWNFNELLTLEPATSRGFNVNQSKQSLAKYCPRQRAPRIGIPLTVAAMTLGEAKQLFANPAIIKDELGLRAYDKFERARAALKTPLEDMYGAMRSEWRALGGTCSVEQLSAQAIEVLRERGSAKMKGRDIKLQAYPIDPLMHEKLNGLRAAYHHASNMGCILLVDELSLFHPEIRRALSSSPMATAPGAAVLTVSPFSREGSELHELFREELVAQLGEVFNRFSLDYDTRCELGVGEECQLRRWLHQNLPETLDVVRTRRANYAQVAMLARDLDSTPETETARLMYSRGLL